MPHRMPGCESVGIDRASTVVDGCGQRSKRSGLGLDQDRRRRFLRHFQGGIQVSLRHTTRAACVHQMTFRIVHVTDWFGRSPSWYGMDLEEHTHSMLRRHTSRLLEPVSLRGIRNLACTVQAVAVVSSHLVTQRAFRQIIKYPSAILAVTRSCPLDGRSHASCMSRLLVTAKYGRVVLRGRGEKFVRNSNFNTTSPWQPEDRRQDACLTFLISRPGYLTRAKAGILVFPSCLNSSRFVCVLSRSHS